MTELSGTVGALTDLLYACLLTGFNLKTLDSLTRDGDTVTGTVAAGHGFATGQCVRIAGANEPDYKGDFVVTATSSTEFTYTITGTPTTPATGTITAKRTPLGWSRVYNGTNKAVFRASAGTQFYLRVDDNSPESQAARKAYCRGYESMTDLDTGEGPFPTTDHLSTGVIWRKSSLADATARDWNLIGDDRFFYLSISPAGALARNLFYFGDIVSFKAGDAYPCAIGGKGSTGNRTTDMPKIYGVPQSSITLNDNFAARAYTQIGGSVPMLPTGLFDAGATTYVSGVDGFSGPNPADTGFHMHQVLVQEVNSLRGKLPGLWAFPFATPLSHWETLDNVDNLDGRTLRAINGATNTKPAQSSVVRYLSI